MTDAFYGILIPFLGTSLGAASVFFLKNRWRLHPAGAYRICSGRDGGGIHLEPADPAMNQSEALGKLAFFPAVVGFWMGILFCCCWIISSHTCTGTANRLRAPTASCSAPP